MEHWRLSRTYEIQAAHRLTGVPSTHKCHRLHGHTYVVTVTVEAVELDDRGFAEHDFSEMDAAFHADIMATFDHQNLNEIGKGLTVPHGTTEELAKVIAERLGPSLWPARLVRVAISENSRSLVEYLP